MKAEEMDRTTQGMTVERMGQTPLVVTTRKATTELYPELQRAYDFFNERLFDDELPPCLITLERAKRTYGYFSPCKFTSVTGEVTHEIAINPAYFAVVGTVGTLSTLVHEMAHLWQYAKGKKSRHGYHNREWADKCKAIGLMPSSTGLPGGKQTGEKMDHYVIADGPFEVGCHELIGDGFSLPWLDRYPATGPMALIRGTADGRSLVKDEPEEELKEQVVEAAEERGDSQGSGDSPWGKSVPNGFADEVDFSPAMASGDVDTTEPGSQDETPAVSNDTSENPAHAAPADPKVAGKLEVVWPTSSPSSSGTTTARNKHKYRCGGCGIQVWGKPGLSVSCDSCSMRLEDQAG